MKCIEPAKLLDIFVYVPRSTFLLLTSAHQQHKLLISVEISRCHTTTITAPPVSDGCLSRNNSAAVGWVTKLERGRRHLEMQPFVTAA